ncbi:MAG: AEC family transporter [Alphaproteobacteria bacterium]|nr:AEC family transporter [Alphaproteobacteria bacterium]MCY4499250.1 AEC family transporter [Rhodospirillaceae bacterium]
MSVIVEVILPIFAIMLAGYAAARTRLLVEGASEAISQFVYYAAAPALAFISLYRTSLEDFFNWTFLGALGGGLVITLCLSLLVAVRFFPGGLTAYGLHGMCTMFPSTGYVGVPLLFIAFGDAGLVPAIIGVVVTGAFFLPISIIFAEIDRGKGQSRNLLRPFAGALASPLVTSAVAGLVASASGLQLPTAAVTFFDILSGAFAPCALFAAGLFMGSRKVRADPKEVTWLVVVKLAIQPLITWWLAYRVFGLDGIWAASAVILAALPTGVPVFVVAQRYGTYVERSAAAVVVSTAVSVFTLSALLIVLNVK